VLSSIDLVLLPISWDVNLGVPVCIVCNEARSSWGLG
jgi:hypothetical protein